MKTKQITQNATMLALLIICSQLSIPLPAIPLTLQTFAVGLIATLMPLQNGLIIICGYLILGTIGLPVFANFTGGVAVIASPLGGYLIGFIVYGLLTSKMLEQRELSWINIINANLLGSMAQLLIGSFWLMLVSHLTIRVALLSGFVPFIVPAIIKIYLVGLVAIRLQKIVSIERQKG